MKKALEACDITETVIGNTMFELGWTQSLQNHFIVLNASTRWGKKLLDLFDTGMDKEAVDIVSWQ